MIFPGPRRLAGSCAAALVAWLDCAAAPGVLRAGNPAIGNHGAIYDFKGMLGPWTWWTDALDREMKWYLACPIESGYPRFVYTTFMDRDYQAIAKRMDTIPSTQNGMGTISDLKYYAWSGKENVKILEFARYMGHYLAEESLTPDTGRYPRFTRSTGIGVQFPQPPDADTQADKPYEIAPGKGGIAAYALMLLSEETKDKKYLDQALQNARVLAANIETGDRQPSRWPFRVDYRAGEFRFLGHGGWREDAHPDKVHNLVDAMTAFPGWAR
jgi:hypothetical protein